MIPRERLINKLRRDLKYEYSRETDKIQEYKKKGGTHRIHLRRKGDFSVEYARQVLGSCGCTEEEINRFIGQTQTY